MKEKKKKQKVLGVTNFYCGKESKRRKHSLRSKRKKKKKRNCTQGKATK